MLLREDEQFDARRTDPRELYEKMGFFGGPKRKSRLSLICICLAIFLGTATTKFALPSWLRTLTVAISGLLFLSWVILWRWSLWEDVELRKPITKDRSNLWRWRG